MCGSARRHHGLHGQREHGEREHSERGNDERENLIGGAVLVALGVAFLAQQVFNFAGRGFPWPFFIIGPGLLLFAAMIAGGRGAGGLAVPATIVTTIGLILLAQSTFDYFESWAYVWALLPTAGGVGTAIAGSWEGSERVRRGGVKAATGGLTMFLIFGGFFELLIFRNGALLAHAWTLALIAVGAFLMLRALGERRRTRDEPTSLYESDQPQDPEEVFPY